MATLTNVAARVITITNGAVSERGDWTTAKTTGYLGYRSSTVKSTVQLRAYLSEPCTSITVKVTPTSTVSSSASFYFKASATEQDSTYELGSWNVTTTDYDVVNSNTKYAWSTVTATINGNFKAGYIYVYIWANATNQLQFGNSTYPTLIESATSATAYSLSLSQGTGSTISVNRSSSNLASTGALSNGAKIYSGDKLKITFTASTGYNIGTHTVNGSTFTSGNTHTVSGNVTVVSTASKITYTVSYNANGGSGAPSNQTKTYGTTLTLSSTKPTRTGYTFQGWGTSTTDTSVDYAAGASYTANAAITLYAIWKANSITFKYYTNTDTQTNFVNWTATADSTFPTNHWQYTMGTYKQTYTGHTGTGYYGTTTTGTDGYLVGEVQKFTSYSDLCEKHGVSVSAASTTVNLYCQWTVDTYVVSFDANGGSGAPSAQAKTYGVTLTLSSTKPTKATTTDAIYRVTFNANGGTCSTSYLDVSKTTSYAFKNWNTAANGSGTSYSAGGSYTANAAATLYAQYTGTTKTASITLPEATRKNYTFLGWAANAGAESGSLGTYTPTTSVTLYAVWESDISGLVYIGDGDNFVAYEVYIGNGSTWERYIPYVANGVTWETCN